MAAPLARVPPSRNRIIRLLGAAFLAADVLAAVVALAVHDDSSTSASAGPRTSASPSSSGASPARSATADASSLALSWMSQVLPRSAPVLADPATAAELVGNGFTGAGRPAQPAYTVSTPALRRAAMTDGSIAAVLRTAVPIALFPTGDGQVLVGAIVDVTPTTLAGHRNDDAQLRLTAGRGLLANPAFHASPSATHALAAGALDLRSATALALMAATGTVDLSSVTSVAAEVRAGLPARTITFAARPAAKQRALLLGLTETYRPVAWKLLPDGSYTATWSIRPDPDDTQR